MMRFITATLFFIASTAYLLALISDGISLEVIQMILSPVARTVTTAEIRNRDKVVSHGGIVLH